MTPGELLGGGVSLPVEAIKVASKIVGRLICRRGLGRGFLFRTKVVGWLPSTNTSNSTEPSVKDSAAGIVLP